MDPALLASILAEHPITEKDLQEWIDYNYPQSETYGRKVAHSGDSFDVLIMSWRPGNYSAIHNHGYAQWGAVIPFGPLHNHLFKVQNKQIQLVEQQLLEPGKPIFVTNDMIHQMGNPSGKNHCSLHIYGCPQQNSQITADSFIYEPEKKRIFETTGGAFLNLPNERVQQVISELSADSRTYVHHAGILLNYYARQTPTTQVQEQIGQLLQGIQHHLQP